MINKNFKFSFLVNSNILYFQLNLYASLAKNLAQLNQFASNSW